MRVGSSEIHTGILDEAHRCRALQPSGVWRWAKPGATLALRSDSVRAEDGHCGAPIHPPRQKHRCGDQQQRDHMPHALEDRSHDGEEKQAAVVDRRLA